MSNFFYVSGFPKSGNKWLQQQLNAFESIGGFATDPDRGLPLLGAMIVDHQPLHDLLGEAGVSFETFVRRAYGCDGPPPNWSPTLRPRLNAILDERCVEASRTAGRRLDRSIFNGVFSDEPRALDRRIAHVGGLPGMHTPLTQVRRLLPTFKIINLQRDPRDVVVSYFYHYIATLTAPLAEKFILRDEATGSIAHNPKWKRPFARRVMRSMLDYHAQRLPEAGEADGVLRVRYEDLLEDGERELRRVLEFVGCEERADTIAAVVQANRFESVTGSGEEQRASLVRKGRSGDWRNYFDRELLRALGDEFPNIVRELGYEADDSWMNEVPRDAPREFEFSRFRIKRSTTRQFAHLWKSSAELRERYPDPWELDEADSFFAWLCECDDQEVRAWLELARRLEELWAVDVVEK